MGASFLVTHDQPLVPLPPQWESYWKLALSPEAGALYEGLTGNDFSGVHVDAESLIHFFGMSKARFRKSILELVDRGFATFDVEDDPPHLSLGVVPEVVEGTPAPARKAIPVSPWKSVWEFVNHWCELCDRYTDITYPRPSRGKTRDTFFVDRMLRAYTLESLKQIAAWWFQHRGAGEPVEIKYFEYHLTRLASEFQNKGGTVLPKAHPSGG